MRVVFILVIAVSITFNCASSQKLSKENEIFLNSKISFKFTDEELKHKEFRKNRSDIEKLLYGEQSGRTYVDIFTERILLELEKQLIDEKVKLLLSENNIVISINEVSWESQNPIETRNKRHIYFWLFYNIKWIVKIDYSLTYNQCKMDFSFQNKTGKKEFRIFEIEIVKEIFLISVLIGEHQYVAVPLILFFKWIAIYNFGDGSFQTMIPANDENTSDIRSIFTKASNKELIQEMLDNFEIVKSTCAEKKGNIK
jgi:hypothetical protein